MSATRWGHEARGDGVSRGKLPPGPHRLPRELVRENQRRRILLAALEVFADRGYAAATVQDLLRAAHVSRATFYENFGDKEACMNALHEDVLDWLWEQVAEAVGEAPDWPGRVRLAVAKTVQLLAEDPRLAAVCTLEASPALPQVRARQNRAVDELCEGLRAGREQSASGRDLPALLELALVSGAIYLIRRSLVYEGGPDPDVLIAELPDLLLLPYRS